MKYIILGADGSFTVCDDDNSDEYDLSASNFFSHLDYKIETLEPTTLRSVLQYLDSCWYLASQGFNDVFMDTLISIFGKNASAKISAALVKSMGGAEEYIEIVELCILGKSVFDRQVYAESMTKHGLVYTESSKLECLLDIPLSIAHNGYIEPGDGIDCNPTLIASNITLYDFLNCIFNKIAVL